MSLISLKISCEFDRHYSLKIEDDGRVAYAYLLEGEDVVGDVWLYNRQQAPAVSFWQPDEMPFLNPAEYLAENASLKPIGQESEVRIEWTESKDDGLIEAAVYIRDKFIAAVAVGSKPGWSVLVAKDGPLAYIY